MQDSDWSEAPKPKRRVPVWVWWVGGGGCLMALLLTGALVFFAFGFARQFADPDRAWAEVAEVLPHDERPAGWEATGASVLGIETYVLTGPDQAGLLLQAFPSSEPLEALFDPQSGQNQGVFGVVGIEEAELGTLELQGREVRCLRFRMGAAQGGNLAVRIDLSGGRHEAHALVQLTSTGDEARFSDERARELLAPFDLWRGR